jgi:hypothetical protein
VRTILVSTTVLFTILFCVSLGVLSAYAIIHAILFGFSHRTSLAEETPILTQEATAHVET